MATKDLTATAPAGADFKVPKQLAACADLMYTTQRERYALEKQVDALKARESVLATHLINNLPKSEALGVAGKIARATIVNKEVATVTDWDQVHDYLLKHAKKNPGVWAIMQRRLSEAAVKEMAAAKKPVPGTEIIEIPVVSLNKLG